MKIRNQAREDKLEDNSSREKKNEQKDSEWIDIGMFKAQKKKCVFQNGMEEVVSGRELQGSEITVGSGALSIQGFVTHSHLSSVWSLYIRGPRKSSTLGPILYLHIFLGNPILCYAFYK